MDCDDGCVGCGCNPTAGTDFDVRFALGEWYAIYRLEADRYVSIIQRVLCSSTASWLQAVSQLSAASSAAVVAFMALVTCSLNFYTCCLQQPVGWEDEQCLR